MAGRVKKSPATQAAANAGPERGTSPQYVIPVLAAPSGGQTIGAVKEGSNGDQTAIRMADAADTRTEYGLPASEAPPRYHVDR